MAFINEYKNRGGRVTTGSDSGFIYKLYGFDYIRELELLQEAGFHPLEVIRSATLNGAEALGHRTRRSARVEPASSPTWWWSTENPLDDLKVLYGTGAIRVTTRPTRSMRVGGVKYTIKDGIVYDAKKLLADVRKIVREAKEKAGRPVLLQPGIEPAASPAKP